MTQIQGGSYYPLALEQLPRGWAAAYVGDVIREIHPGFASGKHNKEQIGVPHLRPMNIDRDGRIDLSVVKYVSPDKPLRLRRGDVLFNNTNSPVLVGKTAAIVQDEEWAFSNHMTRLRPVEGMAYRFLASQLHFLFLCGYFRYRCVKHVNQASVSTNPLAETVPVLVPPTNEQHRIVAKLEELLSGLDAGVAALQRVRANLKRYRASVLKAAVEGKLTAEWRRENPPSEPASALLERILKDRRKRWEEQQLAAYQAKGKEPPKGWRDKYKKPVGPDSENLPELPKGWCWATVKQLISRSEYGTSTKCGYDASGDPVLRIPNIAGRTIDLGDMKYCTKPLSLDSDTALRTGDLLMCRTNGSIGLVGKSALVTQDYEPFHSFASYLLRFRFVISELVPAWVHLYVGSIFGRRFIEKHAASSAGQHNVSLTLMHGMFLPLPPLAELEEILASVDESLSISDQTKEATELDLQRSSRLRQSILKRAFEGTLVSQDPNDEPASKLLERIGQAKRKTEDNGKRGKPNRRQRKTPRASS